ncbi:MAG: hypothetical protein P0Y65_02825 [Candidatus Devosia phytovorans]|uniref:Tetratricopeptide repeat protein n=1 Tax=Candidatus Devosia phytovorans TaxID=3121372 RepID=A0AAJ5VXB8_9HYPH|nr:hypothetical protein [Devosia sp.]WEK05208.1 MAG: hypothetical protein P0Y65_02825 [Devosia sp.]
MISTDEAPTIDEATTARLADARALIEQQDFAAAIALLDSLLEAGLPQPVHVEIQTNLAAALVMLARRKDTDASVARSQLDRARLLLIEALQHYSPLDSASNWASARANLALAYLARDHLVTSDTDILQAHLALDGTEEALTRIGDIAMLEWIRQIRDHLLDLRDRRARPRH